MKVNDYIYNVLNPRLQREIPQIYLSEDEKNYLLNNFKLRTPQQFILKNINYH